MLEISARIYINKFSSEQNFKKYASLKQVLNRESKIKYSPHPYLRYFPTPNYKRGKNKHNSLGYRGDEIQLPKPEGEFRIVCIGGSTTYTVDIDDYRMSYPYLLEKELKDRGHENVSVINAGVGGWTTWESLINLEFRILDLEPDMIIIYNAVNDIHTRFIWPPEAYKGDNTGLHFTTSYITVPSVFEYSSLLRIIMINFGMADSQVSISRWGKMIDESKKTEYVGEFRQQKIAGTYPQGIFKKVSAMQMLKTNKPVYFRRNIKNMVMIANNINIKTVIASFASSPHYKDNPFSSSEEYIYAYEEMNRELRDIAGKTGAYFFDFAGEFPDDKRYYYDGQHVLEEGVRLKSRLFANYLIENRLIPLR